MKKTKYPGVQRLHDGRYLLRVTGVSPKTGKKRNLKRTITASSAAEASRLRESLRAELLRGVADDKQQRLRVADAAISWLRMKIPSLKPATRDRYAVALDHVIDGLGDIYLDQLRSSDIVAWRDSQRAKGSTVNGRLRILKSMLADVMHEHGLPNPAERVASRRESRRNAEEVALSVEELRHLLATIDTHFPKWWPMFLTFAYTGLRAGEVAALRWTHVDFERRLIRICEARYKQTVGTTKTGRTRSVPMADELARALRAHRQRQLRAQASGLEKGLIFPSSVGGYIWNSTISECLRRAVQLAGIDKRFTSHGFRYTFNSLMVSRPPTMYSEA